ncbi:MAG: hypothetical protein WBG23_14860 [Acidobacteriaceae bacterium]|jgi:hypothetical protein
MDIEPPHGPIETWRDFFVHLVIITLGLLIALALEGVVGYIHERHLVHEANANITSEMRDNQKDVEDSVKATGQYQQDMKHLIDLMEDVKAGKKLNGSVTITFEKADLNTASWKTAAATGAIAYMRYRDVKRYEDIYGLQGDFELAQDRAMDSWANVYAPLMHFISQDKDEKAPARLTDAQLAQVDKIEEQTQLYIGRLIAVESIGKALDRDYTRYLQHPNR